MLSISWMKCYYLLSNVFLIKIGRGGKAREGKKRYPAQNILSID